MLIITIKNHYGYNEELTTNKPLNVIREEAKKFKWLLLTIKDTSCLSGCFTINF